MDMSGNERRCYCKGKKAQRKATETFYADNMLTTLEEAYASYKIENPEDKLSLSKFCDPRPPEVKLIHKIPHSLCL